MSHYLHSFEGLLTFIEFIGGRINVRSSEFSHISFFFLPHIDTHTQWVHSDIYVFVDFIALNPFEGMKYVFLYFIMSLNEMIFCSSCHLYSIHWAHDLCKPVVVFWASGMKAIFMVWSTLHNDWTNSLKYTTKTNTNCKPSYQRENMLIHGIFSDDSRIFCEK